MAGEFGHAPVGTSYSQAEFEAVGRHVFDSQATGDMMVASSATQLSRLGISGAGAIFIMNSGGTAPQWSTYLTVVEDGNTRSLLLGDHAEESVIGVTGIQIDQDGKDDPHYVALSSDVDNKFDNIIDKEVTFTLRKWSPAGGGVIAAGYSSGQVAYHMQGYASAAPDTTKSTAARAVFEIRAFQDDGAHGAAVMGADDNMVAIQNGATDSRLILNGRGDLWLNGKIAGGGITPTNYVQNWLGGAFTSLGASTYATRLRVDGALTGASGDTAALVPGAIFAGTTTTQNAADVIAFIAQVQISEPNITLVGGATATVAASLFINGAPDEGVSNAAIWMTAGDVKWAGSLDSAAVADQVAIGGYEIGAGNRVLALSQETAVAVDVDETKFSHKMQLRINGATYFMMLTAT